MSISDFSVRRNHPSESVLLDLARDVIPATDAVRVYEHLDAPCERCRDAYEMWQAIAAASQREADYEPPPESVALAKAMFPVVKRLPLLARIATFAQMVFDSAEGPRAAGVRGGSPSSRHTLHDSERFAVDILIQTEGSGRATLTGQILPKAAEQPCPAGVPLIVVNTAGALIGQGIVNSRGEFHLGFVPEADLHVYFEIPDQGVLRIDLPNALESQSEDSSDSEDGGVQ